MNLNPIPGTSVANKAVLAYKEHLAVATSIVLDVTSGAYGAVIPAGTLLKPLSNGRYAPLGSGDTADHSTRILVQTATLDGTDMPGFAGFVAGWFNIAALVGTTAQIQAITQLVEPGVVVMKTW